MDPLPTMLRDFANRAIRWADILEKEETKGGVLKEVVHVLETPTPTKEEEASYVTADILEKETGLRSKSPASPSVQNRSGQSSVAWRRGDYFFCEGCGQRRQWFRETAPWRGAICAACYNAELARIEAARGRRA